MARRRWSSACRPAPWPRAGWRSPAPRPPGWRPGCGPGPAAGRRRCRWRTAPRRAAPPTPPAARAIPARAGWRRAAAVGRILAVEQAVGHIGRAQLAGHPDIVVARAVAAQRQFRRHGAEHGHADGEVMRAAGGVAADQRAAMNGRQRMETVGEGRQPGFVQPWQRQAQHAADRARAHGGRRTGSRPAIYAPANGDRRRERNAALPAAGRCWWRSARQQARETARSRRPRPAGRRAPTA